MQMPAASQEQRISSDTNIAVVLAAYGTYVTKDWAALEPLIADDFHFTSPLDNRIDRLRISSDVGPTANVPKGLTLFVVFQMAIGFLSPTRPSWAAVAFATPKY